VNQLIEIARTAVFGSLMMSQSTFQLFLEPTNLVELLQSFNQLARYRNIFLRQILDVPFGSLCDLLGVSEELCKPRKAQCRIPEASRG
jgi:hypothetical protein